MTGRRWWLRFWVWFWRGLGVGVYEDKRHDPPRKGVNRGR